MSSRGPRTDIVARALLALLVGTAIAGAAAWTLQIATTDPWGLGAASPIGLDRVSRVEPLYGLAWTPEGPPSWSRDGRHVALPGYGRMAVLDAWTGRTLAEWSLPGEASAVSWFLDGRRVAVMVRTDLSEPGWVFVYDVAGRLERAWKAHAAYAGVLAVSPDGTRILTTAAGEFALWDAETANEQLRVAAEIGQGSVSWSPDGARFVADAWGGPAAFNASNGDLLWRVSDVDGDTQVQWSPRGDLIAVGIGLEWIRFYRPDGSLHGEIMGAGARQAGFFGSSLSWNADGSLVAIEAERGLAVASLDSLTFVRRLVFPIQEFRGALLPGDNNPLDRYVAWSPTGTMIAATGTTSHPTFRLWGLRGSALAPPLLAMGVLWVAGFGLLLRPHLNLLLRVPIGAPEIWLREDPSLSFGSVLFALAVAASVPLALVSSLAGRALGLAAFPSAGWFAWNVALSLPVVVACALLAARVFHDGTWPIGAGQPVFSRRRRVFGFVLAPFLLLAGPALALEGANLFLGEGLDRRALSDLLLIGNAAIFGLGFFLAAKVAIGFSPTRSPKAAAMLLVATLASLAAFVGFGLLFVLMLNTLQVWPVGEFVQWGFRLDLAFGLVPFVAILVAAVLAGILAGGPKALAALFGGYARIRREEVLDLGTRRKVLDLVAGQPGIHFRDLLRVSGLGSGALYYHLAVLEREGILISRREGMYRRFFPIPGRAPSS